MRFLSNHSSGKMGYAVARAASDRGRRSDAGHRPHCAEAPAFVETVEVTSAQEMFDAVTRRAQEQDIIVKAAAVADYRPAGTPENKLKKGRETRFPCPWNAPGYPPLAGGT